MIAMNFFKALEQTKNNKTLLWAIKIGFFIHLNREDTETKRSRKLLSTWELRESGGDGFPIYKEDLFSPPYYQLKQNAEKKQLRYYVINYVVYFGLETWFGLRRVGSVL